MSEEKITIEELESMRFSRRNVEHMVECLGYDQVEDFLDDNEGACEALIQFVIDNAGLFNILMFQPGERVILPARPDEDIPEERGRVVAYEGRGIYLVEVDHSIDDPEDPDGLRETHRTDMRREDEPEGVRP